MKKTMRIRFFICILVALLSVFLGIGCVFHSPGLPRDFQHLLISAGTAEPSKVTSEGGKVVLSAPRGVFVYHGYACAEDTYPNYVMIKKVLELPSDKYIDAIVYLNGWKLEFKDEESEIIGLGTGIAETKLNSNKLSWSAVGVMTDGEDEKKIGFCYRYTVIAWTDFMPESFAKPENIANVKAYEMGSSDASLLNVARYIHEPKFMNVEFAGILPAGFGQYWADYEDDTFLQMAYHLGPTQRYIYGQSRHSDHVYYPEPSLPSPSNLSMGHDVVDFANKGFVSWVSSAIFKNGDSPDPFNFGDYVIGVGGNNFELIHPHFAFKERHQGVLIGSQMPRVKKIKVDNLPYHFAVPVLTGWNIYLHADDEQIKSIGVWIRNFEYDRKGDVGTLTYTLEYDFSDDEGSKCSWQPSVSILGIKEIYPD